MITENSQYNLTPSLHTDITHVLPVIHSFFELYYAHRPKPSFKTIRSSLENIFLGDDALKVYSLEEVERKIDETFSHLLPLEEGAFISLEANLNKIIKVVSEIAKKLPNDSLEYHLLKPVLDELLHLDLPSFSQSWYVLGSLLSIFYIILSKVDENFDKTIGNWMSRMENSNFFQMMFYQS